MKHKASWILAIALVIAGCVLRFAMPGHDFLGYTLWGIAVLVLLWARLHRVGRTVLSVLVCAGLIVFAVFEIPVVRDARTDTGAHPNAIIVLGAGVNGSTPSLSMCNRLDAALDYLGANPDALAVVSGGQTMNPSTADILDAVDKVNAKTIFVLPNNKNIILAANQAAELMTDKELLVIPTKTIPQGITAVINFVPELSVEENEETMLREIKNVKTGQVTYAVRDTVIDDKEIKKDDFMGIGDQGIVAVGTDMVKVTRDMIAELVDEDSELISIYYGCDVAEDAAEALRADLEEAYPACDIELQYGGQPIYYYTVSVE